MSVEICHVCDGYGYTNDTDPDDLSIEKISCKRCEGSGRLVRTKSYATLRSHGIESIKPPEAPYAEVEARQRDDRYSRPPIYLHFAMEIMFSAHRAEKELGTDHFNSPMGKQVQKWLVDEGLVEYKKSGLKVDGRLIRRDEWYEITDKGRAWVEHACATPLPLEVTETKVTKTTTWRRG